MTVIETRLERQQRAAEEAGEQMMRTLLHFEPCRVLTVGEVKFIAERCRTAAFDAIRACAEFTE
jgi:hypothetical protein